MTPVQGTTSGPSELPVNLSAEPVGAGGGSLLASPQTSTGLLDMSNLMLMLNSLTMTARDASLKARDASIQRQATERGTQIEREAAAEKRKADAESSGGGLFSDLGKLMGDVAKDLVMGRLDKPFEDLNDDCFNDPQFWKDLESVGSEVAKWGAVVGSVALSVVSCGAGAAVAVLAIIGAVLCTAGTVESESHVLEKLGVNAEAAQWIGVGLSVAGAICSCGAGFASAGSAAESAASAVTRGARVAATVTDVAAGAGGVVKGAAHIEVTDFQAQAQEAEADVKEAEAETKQIDLLVQIVLGAMKDIYKSSESVVSDLASAETENLDTNVAVLRA
jgi:hypothetical protein